MTRHQPTSRMAPTQPKPHKIALMLELSNLFNALLQIEELVPCIITKIKEVLDAESCAILLLDEERHELYFPVISDVSIDVEERLKGFRFPADRGISGWVLREGRSTLVPDVTQDPRFYSEVDRYTNIETRDLLCVPLQRRHGSLGIVGVRNKRRGVFTNEDLSWLEDLSGTIAVAIENARLYEHLHQSETKLRTDLATMTRELAHFKGYEGIVGNGPAIIEMFSLIENAINSSVTVLLQGETGTGKELVARAIHNQGDRKEQPFVALNCGAVPHTLLAAELFGHKKGAFTDAVNDKPGLFEAAHGGTIFLDEIAETSPAVQVSLLRVLQEHEVRRVGENVPRAINARVIAATSRDLSEEIQRERFRADLYYRLNVFPIRVPPLRERREDIPLLVTHFLTKSSKNFGKPIHRISPKAVALLSRYEWPGNVRELENEIERIVATLPSGTRIAPNHLSERIRLEKSVIVNIPQVSPLRKARMAFEKEYVSEVLGRNEGNVTRTATMLGISRQMLQRKIRDFGLRG